MITPRNPTYMADSLSQSCLTKPDYLLLINALVAYKTPRSVELRLQGELLAGLGAVIAEYEL